MAQINLLPWREERRQQLKKEFIVTIGLVLALGVGLILLGDRIVDGQIQHQKARNQYLAENIKVPRGGVSERGETAGGYRWAVVSSPIESPIKGMKEGTLQEIEVTVAWNDGPKVQEFMLGSVVEGIGK